MFRSVPYKTSFCYFDNKNGYLVIFINLQVKLKYKTFTRRIFHWNSLSAVSCDVNGWSKGTVGMTGDNCFPIHWVSRLKKKIKNESVLILEYKIFLKYHCMTGLFVKYFLFWLRHAKQSHNAMSTSFRDNQYYFTSPILDLAYSILIPPRTPSEDIITCLGEM